jgi:hypothetical protein
VSDEAEFEKAAKRAIDAFAVEAKERDHAVAPVEGRAARVSREREEDEHRRRVGAETREPAVMK